MIFSYDEDCDTLTLSDVYERPICPACGCELEIEDNSFSHEFGIQKEIAELCTNPACEGLNEDME